MDADEEKSGGEVGGTRNPSRLRPSELALLRRMADRFPFTPEDRIRAVTCVNDAIADTDAGWRTRLGGVKCMGELERINLTEVGAAISAASDAPQITNVSVNVSNTRISIDEFRRLPLEDRLRILRGPVVAPPEDRGREPTSP